MRLAVAPKQEASAAHVDPALVTILIMALAARQALLTSKGCSLAEVSEAEGHEPHYLAVPVKLSYLAPDITEAILEGRQPARLNKASVGTVLRPSIRAASTRPCPAMISKPSDTRAKPIAARGV